LLTETRKKKERKKGKRKGKGENQEMFKKLKIKRVARVRMKDESSAWRVVFVVRISRLREEVI